VTAVRSRSLDDNGSRRSLDGSRSLGVSVVRTSIVSRGGRRPSNGGVAAKRSKSGWGLDKSIESMWNIGDVDTERPLQE
jgi:hypothetical protein